jgi:hypothetical protein
MEWAEERTGEAFRKLRDRVLGIPESVKGMAPGSAAPDSESKTKLDR